jgi:spore coat protein CotH
MAPSGVASAQSAAELFDADTIHDIWLNLAPEDWRTLKDRYLEDDYYRADFVWNGYAQNGVGIRSRGSSSRSPVKPSLKIDFSRYDSKRTFAGLKSLILRNMIQEVPMMREHLSLLFMRRLGLPASRATHARLYVNGEYSGLYLLVEDIDERFLAERFPGAIGDLYEYEWIEPYYFEYRGPDPAAYSPVPFKPQTNKKTGDVAALPALFRAINESSDDDFVTQVDAVLDLRHLVNYLAAESFLTETDSLLSTDGVTNFFLYRLPATGRFLFLPWDKNATLLDAELSVFWRVEQNVLIRRTLANPQLRAEYLAALRRCAEAAGGDGGWLEQKTLETYQRIRRAALEDTFKPFSNQEFEDDCESLRFVARSRSASVLRQVEETR